ncbi:MAG: Stp1/IreP family PP2C-type Ser/Thr phosphatase, partial [Solirubrobacterales bacterium]|nr:Stp1/IreP family PP2C-type Ser/Thr phosphatase [Solirubrobacterales bacterium]
MLQIAEAVQLTDTGRQREANEDSYFSRAPLFAVADGMGGAQAGEVASRMAVEAFERVDEVSAPPEEVLRHAAEEANREIFELAHRDASRSGMGTTLTAALLHGDEISFGHVGDSRAYVFREGKLKQITNDHSLVEELRRQGKLTRDQAAEHPQRSVITRALGPEPAVDVDTMTFSARPGDVFLLCSDGLTGMVPNEQILEVISLTQEPSEACELLIA